MTTINSASISNPISDFFSTLPKKNEEVLNFSSTLPKIKGEIQNVVNKAAPVLADELDRRFPNMDVGYTEGNLRMISEMGYVKNFNGEKVAFSPEAREAARQILEVGGLAIINPNDNNNYTSAEELRNLVKYGIPDKTSGNETSHNFQQGDLR
ncbi:hypothetical protein [Noviherbaspirillum malthae]|jgi:hypothetical protein|uniref:hypothetical protein n=1 Tax=Noviherbaspirillum malthae TaxID=1260987 RepID=UPI00188EF918|nr:hypothetical protein [Noviherbaspirillum malthae]